MNKLLVLILMSFVSVSAFAVESSIDDGFNSASAAVSAFLDPLKQGPTGIEKSVGAMPGEKSSNKLIKEVKKEQKVERPISGELKKLMSQQGKVLYYRKTNEEVKLGGKMIKMFYDVYFYRGGKKELMFVVLQPTMTGGYHIMDIQFEDPVDMNAVFQQPESGQ